MQTNNFEYLSAKAETGTTVLKAVMSDFSYAKHAHEELAIGVTTAGVQEFLCEGSLFRSQPGDMILFNPGDVHNGNPGSSSTLTYTLLYLDTKDFYPLLWSASDTRQTEFRFSDTHFGDPVLRALTLQMSQIVPDERRLSVEYEHCRYRIAQRLGQHLQLATPDRWSAHKDALLLRVRDYIHDNVIEDISIDELSALANISKFHFIRMFRKQFGLTPHKYILNAKVNKARASLEAGLPPTTVAHELGFFDVSHLNRHFKLAFGLTPKQYQSQIQN